MKFFYFKTKEGFSIVELMVVVVILGGLASLAMPRLRQFIAASRQAEAKNLLAQIHTLQVSYQTANDKFARWAFADRVGYGGNCDAAIVANTTPDRTPGPYELGFKPQNCSDLRYGYWVIHGDDGAAKEGYMAVAYAPSDTTHRIYPTCTGPRTITMTHPFSGIADVSGTQGDYQTVNEDKAWGHNDIIEACK